MAIQPKLGTKQLLFQSATQLGLTPEWVIPGRLFGLRILETEYYLNDTKSTNNTHLSSGMAKDKYLTRIILERHGMRNIPYHKTDSLTEAASFLREHGTIIAKPTHGMGSKDIHIISDASELSELAISNYILERYIPGTEMRYLLLDGEVIAVHESEYGASVAEDRVLQRISYPVDEWDTELVETSQQIAKILGLNLTAIDFMIDEQGTAFVLEVNSAPGLKWFHSPTSGPPVDVATLFLQSMVREIERAAAYTPPIETIYEEDLEPGTAPATTIALVPYA